MAGSSPVDLAVAVAEAGGMGAMGALLSSPETISDWAARYRSRSNGPFQLNLWIPDPAAPLRDFSAEQQVREFLARWGPRVPAEVNGIRFPDFEKQCDSFLAIKPTVVSSIMGLYPAPFVAKLKDHGIAWFACATTLAEAREAERAGADASRRAGLRGWRPPRFFRAIGSRTPICGPLCIVATLSGQTLGANHRSGRHRGWSRDRRRPSLGGERSPARHGFPPMSGNGYASNVGGGVSRFGAGSNRYDAGVYRAAWPLG
jgi:nitronate monooxygenase